MIVVTVSEKCRRAGIDFKKGVNKFEAGELRNAQLAQLKADSRFAIEHVSDTDKGERDASN
ncbi:HI1506-related protein [Idiomarina xiamenensis]|uniref:Mu-like prophage FluMu N-terminal domain-containing protein n=1 Tax=Idiomarina xiamenensis 10-D-4 TaxID=740709 RepID=K2KQF0_9GAMM|nr:HI1506-related protein [Idiomarina xiamenensis]EKE79720.1 hypothetical protein A10D4_12709 [Idiomarina xiamenensis 10-D-4]